MLARLCSADPAKCDGRQPNTINPAFLGVLDDDQPEADAPSEAADGGAGEPARVVTIEDLARFLPATVVLHTEPNGWAVVGVPTNFWTRVQPLVVQGRLLGEDADVRFTPRLYEWRYGDGSSRMTDTGGSSWAGAGQDELTATATSHVYRAKDRVDAQVTVIWSAEYRFAGAAWTPVAGAVSSASPRQDLLVVREQTVLTGR